MINVTDDVPAVHSSHANDTKIHYRLQTVEYIMQLALFHQSYILMRKDDIFARTIVECTFVSHLSIRKSAVGIVDIFCFHSYVNLTLHKGEFIYLIGRTGSGKSSLLKTLYGELPARDGIFKVAGYDLTKLKRKDIPYLRRKIGIVFQDFQLLFDRTVEKNLAFVLGATGWTDSVEISKRIDEVLSMVGLSDKRKSMPHQMSGGEQQGVAIARALLNAPDVILADEPTGNLDPDTTLDVMKLLRRISENGQAVLMATHNYTLMQKYPSRIANCKNGTVVCSEME